MKKSNYYNSDKRKTISDFYSRATTPPATFRQKKLIARRNSWPPVAPLKLTKRRKYHELIKIKDFYEPFWMDTYDWLTMKSAPEKFKVAPLAKLSEFDECDSIFTYEKHKKAHYKIETNANIYCLNSFNTLSFYFVLGRKQKQIIERKKYLQNLRNKCFVDAVKSIKPTNFDSLTSSDVKLDINKNFIENAETNLKFEIKNEIPGAFVNVESNLRFDDNSFSDMYDTSFNAQTDFPYQEHDVSYFMPVHRSVRPLQSYNGSSSMNTIITCSVMPDLDMQFHKPKVLTKDYFKNKENIKVTNCFPNAKYPEHIEKIIAEYN